MNYSNAQKALYTFISEAIQWSCWFPCADRERRRVLHFFETLKVFTHSLLHQQAHNTYKWLYIYIQYPRSSMSPWTFRAMWWRIGVVFNRGSRGRGRGRDKAPTGVVRLSTSTADYFRGVDLINVQRSIFSGVWEAKKREERRRRRSPSVDNLVFLPYIVDRSLRLCLSELMPFICVRWRDCWTRAEGIIVLSIDPFFVYLSLAASRPFCLVFVMITQCTNMMSEERNGTERTVQMDMQKKRASAISDFVLS